MPDRCDRCCARARVWWAPVRTELDERALAFCEHHGREYEEALVMDGWVLVPDDEPAYS